MGNPRPRPKRLAEKLKEIRLRLENKPTQSQLVKLLGYEEEFGRERISLFERGILEPPLQILCAYADLANVYLDVIVRDELDLPDILPSISKNDSVKSMKTKI